MQVVHPVCCGIDVHQAQLTACLRCVSPEGQVTTERQVFGTTYAVALKIFHAADAATGSRCTRYPRRSIRRVSRSTVNCRRRSSK